MRRIFNAVAIAAILASTATAAPTAEAGVILRGSFSLARPVWKIPEPSTLALVALALLSVVRLRP
jgi:hypothetical protein